MVRKGWYRKKEIWRGDRYQVKIKFSSNRSVQNSNLTSETDDWRGKSARRGDYFTPWEKIFTYNARTRGNVRRGRKGEAFTAAQRGEIVENDKQDESYSNRETRSWI